MLETMGLHLRMIVFPPSWVSCREKLGFRKDYLKWRFSWKMGRLCGRKLVFFRHISGRRAYMIIIPSIEGSGFQENLLPHIRPIRRKSAKESCSLFLNIRLWFVSLPAHECRQCLQFMARAAMRQCFHVQGQKHVPSAGIRLCPQVVEVITYCHGQARWKWFHAETGSTDSEALKEMPGWDGDCFYIL